MGSVAEDAKDVWLAWAVEHILVGKCL